MSKIKSAFGGGAKAGVVWNPSENQIESANITKFMKKHRLKDYDQFLEKAVNEPEWFYPAVIAELGITWFKEYKRVMDLSNGIEMPKWFPGGLTNLYYYGLFKHKKNGNDQQLALIWEGEDGNSIFKTYGELLEETDRLAAGLYKIGVKKGDRVGVFLPQIPEIQPILFACAKLGAVVIPCFSGFGAEAVALRLKDGGAKWFFTADGFYRKGKVIDMKAVSGQVLEKVPTIEKVIIVQRISKNTADSGNKELSYDDLLDMGKYEEIVMPEPMASTEPFMIIYTSGTTGKPKGTRHTHYSFPLKNALDMYFSFDLKQSDRIFWLTDIGWMMGPWHIFGTAIIGAAAVMYEGSPDYPNENRLWQLVEKHRVTIFGVAPTVIRSLMKYKDEPVRSFDLSSLRILGSTGEAWNPEPWIWFFEKVGGKRCPIINYSGGTEISGGILGCVPIKPLKPCAFHGPVPGMAATIVDISGKEMRNHEVGDLVITKPFLGMTYSFWNDHQRYLDTYWSRWKGLWYHGDFAQVDEDGFWYILGRSDDTMNVAGKRIGPAELESAVSSHPGVKESAAIAAPDEVKGEVPVLFIVPHEKEKVNMDQFVSEIKNIIAETIGKAFMPRQVHVVEKLPRTQSGKIARRVVRSAYLGEQVGDISTLADSEVIMDIQRIR